MKQHQKFIRIGAVALTATAIVLTSAVTPAQAATKTYTLAQIKAHKSASNCWSAVNGKVYNLTTWVKKHPGGASVIKSMCGRDASAAYKSQHGTAARPAKSLIPYKIGNLAKVQPQPTSTVTPTPTATPTAGATLNLALVSKHSTASDCWTIVNGNVYNVTAWIAPHKGGSGPIIAMCGIDASAAYSGTHGTASKPASTLNTFKVGAVGTAAP